jgi:hypothetical protein
VQYFWIGANISICPVNDNCCNVFLREEDVIFSKKLARWKVAFSILREVKLGRRMRAWRRELRPL